MSSSEYTIRPVTQDDRGQVDELCSLVLPNEDAGDPANLQHLLWETPGVAGFVASVDGAVMGAIFGTVSDGPSGRSAALTLIAVRPEHSRRGLGARLLATLEGWATSLGAVELWSGGGQPRFWWPGVDSRWAAVLQFFTRAGFVADEDDAPNMVVDLRSADLSTNDPAPILIRRLEEQERPGFHEWMVTTWENTWPEEIDAAFRRSPVSCYVATLGGEYVGFAGYDTNRRGWFGPMGTSPTARGTGLGGELLRRCLRDYVEQGRDECEIGWVGPAEFYTKTVGARLGRRFIRMRKALPMRQAGSGRN